MRRNNDVRPFLIYNIRKIIHVTLFKGKYSLPLNSNYAVLLKFSALQLLKGKIYLVSHQFTPTITGANMAVEAHHKLPRDFGDASVVVINRMLNAEHKNIFDFTGPS